MLAAFASIALLTTPAKGLIDEVRHALHTDRGPAAAETLLAGRANIYGTPAQYALRFQSSGSFSQAFDGRLGEKFGSDGTRVWKVNRDGVARVQSFEDVDEIMAEILLLTDRWVDPKLDGTLTVDGNTVHLKLNGGLTEQIDVDPQSHLPVAAALTLSGGPIKIRLGDWKSVGGREYPFHATVTMVGEEREYVVQQASAKPAPDPSAYVMPARKAMDVYFDASKPAALEVRRAISGHLLVKPLVNGRDVGWFIFDSGAESMCIDPKVANDLGLERVGSLPVTGVGGTVKGSFRPVKTFTLGAATMRDVYFIEIDLGDISKFFRVPIAGVVGDEYFDRSVITVNVAKPAISVNDPTTYTLPPGGAWSTLRFESGNPLVEATANGDLSAWYRIDTGDPSTVTFHAPYVQRERLLEGRKTEDSTNGGVGGTVAARQGRIKQFELGGHRFEDLEAGFSLAKEGAFADLYVAGNIGQALMRPFNIVFDYGNSRIAFLPK